MIAAIIWTVVIASYAYCAVDEIRTRRRNIRRINALTDGITSTRITIERIDQSWWEELLVGPRWLIEFDGIGGYYRDADGIADIYQGMHAMAAAVALGYVKSIEVTGVVA